MKIIENKSFDEERALYGSREVLARNCRFDGPADGESAFKESAGVAAENCFFNLRYPFWHDKNLAVRSCVMTQNCRAALWYSEDVSILNTELHGIKALRECKRARLSQCDIVSPEFGWSSKDVSVSNCTAEGEYFFLRGENLNFSNVKFSGKYSFQYIENAVFENCRFVTKDAFWHAKNVTVKNCAVEGEYLAWYSQNLTFIGCKIVGTQPFCYCKNLKLLDCEMTNADLAFEKSRVRARLTAPIDSIKNPLSGKIEVPAVGKIVRTDPNAKGRIVLTRRSGAESIKTEEKQNG